MSNADVVLEVIVDRHPITPAAMVGLVSFTKKAVVVGRECRLLARKNLITWTDKGWIPNG